MHQADWRDECTRLPPRIFSHIGEDRRSKRYRMNHVNLGHSRDQWSSKTIHSRRWNRRDVARLVQTDWYARSFLGQEPEAALIVTIGFSDNFWWELSSKYNKQWFSRWGASESNQLSHQDEERHVSFLQPWDWEVFQLLRKKPLRPLPYHNWALSSQKFGSRQRHHCDVNFLS